MAGRLNLCFVFVACLVCLSLFPVAGVGASSGDLLSGDPVELPVPGMPTMAEIGAKSCVPCRMMAPVIESLSKEYQGRVAVVFIDVWKNKGQARKYRVRSIPTQIFYDGSGMEVFRHVGFFPKEKCMEILDRISPE